ncbi:ATP-binding cassette domain-containing protein [Chelatococcus sp. YT9]|nr:ATP-binding cassette domain-containing protein [Chelatococcus sp. YT9]MBS7701230.1 ATP-binding cassette domain-containing protein [Chelatococcus sp. YT9]MBX3557361.1 ATP-binding cassette domain-containing protein [Chelatococcus sp.]
MTRTIENGQLACVLTCAVLTGVVPDLVGSSYWSYSFQYVNVLVALAIVQNFLLYDANQTSFGQGAIFGVGAYAAAMAMTSYGLYWPAALLCAALAGCFVSIIYAVPALRVQGYYLGFVTLSVAMVFPEMLMTFDEFTNGVNGISTPAGTWKQPLLFSLTPLSLLCAAVACGAAIAHVALRRSALGRKIRVAGASPEAAQTLGIRPGLVRSAVFCSTGATMGAIGALYPPIVGFVSPAAFHLELSILLFLAVIVGGRGQILGPLAGIYMLYLVPNVLLVDLVDYRLLAYGVIALLVMLMLPDGLVGTLERHLRTSSPINGLRFSMADLPVSGGDPGAKGPAISVAAACKSFGSVKALDDVCLDVERGCIVGLVGANGSGKTSLINAITGFSQLDKGSIIVRDSDISAKSPAAIAKLGVIRTFQTPRIFGSLTAWENIAIGSETVAAGKPAHDMLPDLHSQLRSLHTDAIPHGQRRSIEVLRAFLTNADILLLDEPAAGLSKEERSQLAILLRRLRDEARRTIVIVEHDLDLVWRVADKIVAMENGRVVAHGSPGEMRQHKDIKKLFVSVEHA